MHQLIHSFLFRTNFSTNSFLFIQNELLPHVGFEPPFACVSNATIYWMRKSRPNELSHHGWIVTESKQVFVGWSSKFLFEVWSFIGCLHYLQISFKENTIQLGTQQIDPVGSWPRVGTFSISAQNSPIFGATLPDDMLFSSIIIGWPDAELQFFRAEIVIIYLFSVFIWVNIIQCSSFKCIKMQLF